MSALQIIFVHSETLSVRLPGNTSRVAEKLLNKERLRGRATSEAVFRQFFTIQIVMVRVSSAKHFIVEEIWKE